MKTFYVSLVKDLLGYYLEFEAESELAVRQYLVKEYFRHDEWKLPWCSVYGGPKQLFEPIKAIIVAPCGPLYEEVVHES